jgi:hypothetical protein
MGVLGGGLRRNHDRTLLIQEPADKVNCLQKMGYGLFGVIEVYFSGVVGV